MKATKKDAAERFEKMYNCCQAVVCAYCEELGVKEEDVFRMTEGFGTWHGRVKRYLRRGHRHVSDDRPEKQCRRIGTIPMQQRKIPMKRS